MSTCTATLEAACKEYKELVRMREELEAALKATADQIKAIVDGSETTTAGQYKITYKDVTTHRIDTKALKAAAPDIAERFTVATTTKRFTVTRRGV